MVDIHNHSKYSFDSKAEPKEMLELALLRGAKVYGFAEHVNLDEKSDINAVRKTVGAYIEELNALQFSFEKLRVLRGVEFNYYPSQNDDYKLLTKEFDFDYVVNSVHDVRGKNCYVGYFNDGKIDEGYRAYFDYLKESMEVPYPYHVLGHMGFLYKSAKNLTGEEYFHRYQKYILEILEKVVEKGVALEANTNTYGASFPCDPDERILRAYYEMGGRKITIGADSHSTCNVMKNVEETVRLLAKIGFTHLSYFVKGEEYRFPIEEKKILPAFDGGKNIYQKERVL